MIVRADGVIRSESTFAFNIVRELLRERGRVGIYSSNDLQVAEYELSDSAHVVIKTHSPNKGLLNAIKARHLPCRGRPAVLPAAMDSRSPRGHDMTRMEAPGPFDADTLRADATLNGR